MGNENAGAAGAGGVGAEGAGPDETGTAGVAADGGVQGLGEVEAGVFHEGVNSGGTVVEVGGAGGDGGVDDSGCVVGVGAGGGVQPVVGAGSADFGCTIFSRFSRTLKLKRRRFGFPRRPASPASAAEGSAAGALGGLLGGAAGPTGALDGAKLTGAGGPLMTGGWKAGWANGEPTGWA